MDKTTLHYIYDPLCGWCYGAAPLVAAARKVVRVQAHGGGMMTGAQRRTITAQLREYVVPQDARIAQLSGQPFGQDYLHGLLYDSDAVLDSAPPTTAMLAADRLAGRGLDMLAQLQIAHYVQGKRIAEEATLIEMAASLGLDREVFAMTLKEVMKVSIEGHFRDTRDLMDRIGARGFPAFALENGTTWQSIDISRHFGHPEAFASELRKQIDRLAALQPPE